MLQILKKMLFYRFLNSTHINWEKFLLLLSSTIIKNSIVKLTSEDRLNAIVIDDSFMEEQEVKL